jgi:hypothetical protein
MKITNRNGNYEALLKLQVAEHRKLQEKRTQYGLVVILRTDMSGANAACLFQF